MVGEVEQDSLYSVFWPKPLYNSGDGGTSGLLIPKTLDKGQDLCKSLKPHALFNSVMVQKKEILSTLFLTIQKWAKNDYLGPPYVLEPH